LYIFVWKSIIFHSKISNSCLRFAKTFLAKLKWTINWSFSPQGLIHFGCRGAFDASLLFFASDFQICYRIKEIQRTQNLLIWFNDKKCNKIESVYISSAFSFSDFMIWCWPFLSYKPNWRFESVHGSCGSFTLGGTCILPKASTDCCSVPFYDRVRLFNHSLASCN